MFEADVDWSTIVNLKMVTVGVIGVVFSCMNTAVAQIIPDTTLPQNSRVTNIDNIINIDNGTQSGSNLFHSFQNFSVPKGSTAYFNNALSIQNIISRVTGKSISNIDGLIRSNGKANLFLINPNGIVFGENARLDIGGSFFASTASLVKFSDDFEFSAANTSQAPLLTISAPVGLQMGKNPGSIQAKGNTLQVQQNQTLALVGGNLSLEGAILNSTGGSIELGSVTDISLVSITAENQGFSLSYDNVQEFGDINISQQAEINASGIGGDIQVRGKAVTLTDGAFIGTSTSLSQGGNLKVTAESVNLIGTSTNDLPSALFTLSDSLEDGGDLTINTSYLLIENGAQVFSATFGAGKSGDLTVNAESININGRSANGSSSLLAISSRPNATGDLGDLTINTRDLLVQNGAQVIFNIFGAGKSGNLTVIADSINITGTNTNTPTGFFTLSEPDSTVDAGDLTINTRDLLVQNAAQVNTSTFGAGKSGNLTITADSINITGGIFSAPSGFFAVSEANATGDAGDLTINTRELLIQNGGQVANGTRGAGSAGNLTVTADSINIIGRSTNDNFPSGLFASSEANATGDAGNLTINTRDLLIEDGSGVTVTSVGAGNAGKLDINASSIRLDNQAVIGASTRGGEGNIFLKSPFILLRNRSVIATNATGENNPGGNITIDATDGFILAVPQENSDIIANSADSQGGNVTINTTGLLGIQVRNVLTPESAITSTGANSELNGSIQINIQDIDVNKGSIQLPSQPLETTVAQGCKVNRNKDQSSFVIMGRGGLPQNPKESFKSDYIQLDWATLNPETKSKYRQAVTIKPTATHRPQQIVEAKGWLINERGEVVLTANPTNYPSKDYWQSSATCDWSKID